MTLFFLRAKELVVGTRLAGTFLKAACTPCGLQSVGRAISPSQACLLHQRLRLARGSMEAVLGCWLRKRHVGTSE